MKHLPRKKRVVGSVTLQQNESQNGVSNNDISPSQQPLNPSLKRTVVHKQNTQASTKLMPS